MDDSLILVPSRHLKTTNCIHSSQIPIWVDFYAKESNGGQLKEHIEACVTCQQEVKRHQEKIAKIEALIPVPRLTSSVKEEILIELNEIVKNRIPQIVTPKKHKVVTSMKFGKSMMIDLGRAAVSSSMLMVYLFFAVVYWTKYHTA